MRRKNKQHYVEQNPHWLKNKGRESRHFTSNEMLCNLKSASEVELWKNKEARFATRVPAAFGSLRRGIQKCFGEERE
jgi:hypothetical protein